MLEEASSCLRLILSLILLSVCHTPKVLRSQSSPAPLCTSSSSPLSTPDYKIKSALNPVNTTLRPWNGYSAVFLHWHLYGNCRTTGVLDVVLQVWVTSAEVKRSSLPWSVLSVLQIIFKKKEVLSHFSLPCSLYFLLHADLTSVLWSR